MSQSVGGERPAGFKPMVIVYRAGERKGCKIQDLNQCVQGLKV